MRRTLAVAARELQERWLLLPGGLALGGVWLVLPLFGLPKDAAWPVGLLSALLLGGLAALLTGWSMFARDAEDGRLAFLLDKPVPWPAVWGGKWIAAGLLAGASGLLAAIPWMTAYPPPPESGGASWLRAMANAQGWTVACLLLILIAGSANFASTVFRSRSKWLVVDLALLVAVVWGVLHYVAPIRSRMGSPNGWESLLWPAPLALGLALGFLLGSAAQLAIGRTDLQRAHRALSIVFWSLVVAALVGWGGYLRWRLWTTNPADIMTAFTSRDAGGSWVYVMGRDDRWLGSYQGFLLEPASGRYLTLPGNGIGNPLGLGVAFAADGRSAATLLADDAPRQTLLLFDMSGSAPQAERITLQSRLPLDTRDGGGWGTLAALSPSGASVIVAEESGVTLYRLPSGHKIAEVAAPRKQRAYAMRFLSEHTARTWALVAHDDEAGPATSTLVIMDLSDDGVSRVATVESLGAVVFPRAWPPVIPDASGTHILTRDDAGLHLRDGATGALLATLVPGAPIAAGSFLADGRIVTVSGAPAGKDAMGQPRLTAFDAAGRKLREVSLDRRVIVWPRIGPEIAKGRVLVSSFGESLLVDVDEGRTVERLLGLRIPDRSWPGDVAPAPATPRSVQFLLDGRGRLIQIDFATGQRRIIAGPGAPKGERLAAF